MKKNVGHTGAGHAFGACADGWIGTGGACGKQRSTVAFKQVPNDTLDTLIRPDVAVGEIEDAEMGEDTAAYQAHDLVRVSIILEDTSTLEAYSDAAAEGTLAEDAAAVSYRAALQRKQDSIVRKISSTILGREELDVVWNLTLVANLISANVEYGKIEQIKQIPGRCGCGSGAAV